MSSNVKPHILIVEDTEIDALVRILSRYYTLSVVQTAEAARSTLQQSRPDLILLNVALPDQAGFDLLAEFKAHSQTRDIPVVIITDVDNVRDEEKGLTLGAVDNITKPFHGTIVLARIKTHIQIVQYLRTIERLGLLDVLTELPNRHCFGMQLGVEWARAIREKTPLALLKIEINRFEEYAGVFGPVYADEFLRAVAKAITSTTKRPGDMVARFGISEFALLLPSTDFNGAVGLARALSMEIATLPMPGTAGNQSLVVSANFGVAATIPTMQSSMDDLIELADNHLLKARATGNTVVGSVLEGEVAWKNEGGGRF